MDKKLYLPKTSSNYINIHSRNKELKNSLDEIRSIFPYLEAKVILEALKANNENTNQTIDYLLNQETKVESDKKNNSNIKSLHVGNKLMSQEDKLKLTDDIMNDLSKIKSSKKPKSEKIGMSEAVLNSYFLRNQDEKWKSKIKEEHDSMNENKKTCLTLLNLHAKNKQNNKDYELLKQKRDKLNMEVKNLIDEKYSKITLLDKFNNN